MRDYFSVDDVAAMSGLSVRTIRRYIAAGQLEGEKADGVWRFTAEQFGAFLRQDMVRRSVRAKVSGRVCDFLLAEKRGESAVCLIWDQPVAGGEAEERLRERLTAEVDRLGLVCVYRFEKGLARAVLTGPPAAVSELLARLG